MVFTPPQTTRPKGIQFRLSPADLELLLQILNDLRVGSCILLGCPDPTHATPTPEPEPSGDSARHFLAMEFCGALQAQILSTLDQPHDPPPQ